MANHMNTQQPPNWQPQQPQQNWQQQPNWQQNAPAPKPKKPIYKRVWFWILIVLVVIIIAGVAGGSGSSSSNQATPSNSAQPAATQDSSSSTDTEDKSATSDYKVTDQKMSKTAYSLTISGKLTNNTSNNWTYVQIEYTIYDKDGTQLGNAYANTTSLKAGKTWKFKAIGTAESSAKKYEISDVTYY